MSRIERRKQERLDEVRRFAKESDIPVHNMELLNVALTHTSYANEHRNLKVHDNERLEFLGDAVLDLAVGDYLFRRFPEWPVGDYMLLGRGEEMSGGRTRVSILGNAFESVIGAVYLDNGYEMAAKFILGHMQKFLDLVDQGIYDHDYKSDLQEIAQKNGDVDIRYEVVRDEGPDHDKTIWMELFINGKALGTGIGKNKKEAAQNAAKEAIERLHKGESVPPSPE